MIGDVNNIQFVFNRLLQNKELKGQLTVQREAIQTLQNVKKGDIKAGISCFQEAVKGEDNNSFLPLVALQIIDSIIKQNQLKLIHDVLQITYSNIRTSPVNFKAELTSIIYQLLGTHYQKKQQYALASLNFKKSIACNPQNFHSIRLLKELMLIQHSAIKSNLFQVETKDKIAIMIITCQKNKHLIPFLQKYLYQKVNLPYFFVIGNLNLDSDWFCESNILYVKAPDDYNSLTAKVTKALECLYGLFDFQGILKFDDDVWIKDTDKFLNFINWLEHDCKDDYFGQVVGQPGFMSTWMGRCYHFGRGEPNILENEPYKKPNLARYCGGGEGYYLSRQSINTVVEYYLKCPDTIYHESCLEDKYVGETLYLHGIEAMEYNLSQFGLISDVDIKALQQHLQTENPHLEIDPNIIYKAIKT